MCREFGVFWGFSLILGGFGVLVLSSGFSGVFWAFSVFWAFLGVFLGFLGFWGFRVARRFWASFFLWVWLWIWVFACEFWVLICGLLCFCFGLEFGVKVLWVCTVFTLSLRVI